MRATLSNQEEHHSSYSGNFLYALNIQVLGLPQQVKTKG